MFKKLFSAFGKSSESSGKDNTNQNVFPLFDSEIKKSSKRFSEITNIYAHPTYLTDEVMSSIYIGGKRVTLPATLEELGDDYTFSGYKFSGGFVSHKFNITGEADQGGVIVIGTIDLYSCQLNYKKEPLVDVSIYGYKKFDLKKCPILDIYDIDNLRQGSPALRINNIIKGESFQNVTENFGQPIEIADNKRRGEISYSYTGDKNNANDYAVAFFQTVVPLTRAIIKK